MTATMPQPRVRPTGRNAQPEQQLPDEQWSGERRRGSLQIAPNRSQRRARPRTFYAILTLGTLGVFVVVQLLLSIGVSQGAYQLQSLQDQQTVLGRSYQAASEKVNSLSSPQNLAANANALGMVANGTTVYLRLSDGAILGTPSPTATSGQASSNLIPNSLLNGVPLVTGNGTAGDPNAPATSASNPATPGTNSPTKPSGPVPWDGALPAPTTH